MVETKKFTAPRRGAERTLNPLEDSSCQIECLPLGETNAPAQRRIVELIGFSAGPSEGSPDFWAATGT